MESKGDLRVDVSENETLDHATIIKNMYGFCVDPRFTDLVPVAQGGNGMVFSAVDSDCEKHVAIKKICFCDQTSCKYALRELRVVRQLQHENVVTVYEILGPNGFSLDGKHTIPADSDSFNSVYIVQEHMDVSLFQLTQACRLSQEHIKFFLYQLLRGLKYIHSANLIHRDIKPSNILLSLDDLVLKIGDFGLARVVDPAYSHKGYLTDRVGTCWYRAPELILTPRDYSAAIDIWGVGCILGEMLTGQPLFPGAQEMEQIGHILDTVVLTDNEWNKVTQVLPNTVMKRHQRFPKRTVKARFSDLDPNAVDILEAMLTFSPSSRVTAEAALSHPYLEQYSCLEDEPVVCRPFRIEHEVDDLSPEILRQLIITEGTSAVGGCGSQRTPPSFTADATSSHKITSPSSPSSKPSSVGHKTTSQETRQQNNPDPVRSRVTISEEHTKHDVKEKKQPSSVRCMKESLFIDVTDLENAKEFCQLSPKERADRINSQYKQDQRAPDKNSLAMSVKMKDRVNAQRRGKPSGIGLGSNSVDLSLASRKTKNSWDGQSLVREEIPPYSSDGAKFGEHEKLDGQNIMKSPDDFCKFKEKSRSKESLMKKQMGKQKKSKQKTATVRDFDSLYRLPTEHLCRHRRRTDDRLLPKKPLPENNIENHVKLREELNERLRLAEIERDHFRGAVGGTCSLEDISPPGQISFEVDHVENSEKHYRSGKHAGRTFPRETFTAKVRRDSSSSSDDQRFEG